MRQRVRAAGEPGPGGGLQMLYIQMEFCPRTLRQALDEGPMHDPDAWQVRGGAPEHHAASSAGRAAGRAAARLRRARPRAGRAAAARGAGAHPRAGHHPPRPQARQHLLRQPRRHQAGRLWPGQICVQRGRRRRAGGRAGAAAGRAPAPALIAPAWPPAAAIPGGVLGRAARCEGAAAAQAGGRAPTPGGRRTRPRPTAAWRARPRAASAPRSTSAQARARSRADRRPRRAARVPAWLRSMPYASEPTACVCRAAEIRDGWARYDERTGALLERLSPRLVAAQSDRAPPRRAQISSRWGSSPSSCGTPLRPVRPAPRWPGAPHGGGAPAAASAAGAAGMERAVLLADLQATGALPAEWETAHPQARSRPPPAPPPASAQRRPARRRAARRPRPRASAGRRARRPRAWCAGSRSRAPRCARARRKCCAARCCRRTSPTSS